MPGEVTTNYTYCNYQYTVTARRQFPRRARRPLVNFRPDCVEESALVPYLVSVISPLSLVPKDMVSSRIHL